MLKPFASNAYLCEDLESNIADEANARRNYYALLRRYSAILDKYEIQEIEEIVEEELKHTEILRRMIERRSGLKPEL